MMKVSSSVLRRSPGGHWQQRNDIDDDGWADLAGYSRGIVRPRVFWSDGSGRTLFATGGAMSEERRGGTMPSAVLMSTGDPYPESLDTRRFDGGFGRADADRGPVRVDRSHVCNTQRRRFLRGDVRERDIQDAVFGELAMRGTAPRQTWVGGVAFERSTLDPRDQPQFACRYNVPGLFPQDDIELQR